MGERWVGERWVVACLKWVALRPDIDPLTGTVDTDDRFSGPSPADEAALEWALRMGETWSARVLAVTVGPAESERMLRDALACGAAAAVRVDSADAGRHAGRHGAEQPPSDAVADALAVEVRRVVTTDPHSDGTGNGPTPSAPGDTTGPAQVLAVVCGDASVDRGSASVPPLLAHRLGAAQACGLVSMQLPSTPGAFTAERRLDGGRREQLRTADAGSDVATVVSVEAGSARLRRASLAGVLAAQRIAIAVHSLTRRPTDAVGVAAVGPFRPRAKVLEGPTPSADAMKRIVALTGALSDRTPPQRLVLEPGAAADRILSQLQQWGYR